MFYKSLLICALCLPAVLSLEFIFGERKENDVALLNVTKKYKFDSPAKLYEIVHQYSPESAAHPEEKALKINYIRVSKTNAINVTISEGGLGGTSVEVFLWTNQSTMHYFLEIFGHPSASFKTSPSSALLISVIGILLWGFAK